jgi:hypothetical protein
MPTEIVTRNERCAYCLRDTIVVTVEQLLSTRGDVIASTVLVKERCTNAECIGSRMQPR